MAGRLSIQATHPLEEGEMQVSASPSSSLSVPNKLNQSLSKPDLTVHKDGNSPPSLNTTRSDSIGSKAPNSLPQKQLISPSSGTVLPPLEQGSPALNLDDAAKHRSFLQAAQSASEWSQETSDLPFPLKQTTLHQGKPSIAFSTEEQSVLLAGLKFVLVGKFTHGRPPMSVIHKFFADLKLKGKFKLSLLDKKHTFIECFSKADYYFIWLKLSWSILGFSMRIFKWDADFVITKESSVAPVWIRITNLPLYFFEVKTLLSIANVIGCSIKIDPRNVNRADLGTARICVELDVAKPLIDAIWINLVDDSTEKLSGFWVNVSYDVVPAYCLECFHIGHDRDNCKRLMEEKHIANTISETEPVGQKFSAVLDAKSLVEQPGDFVVDATASDAGVEVVQGTVDVAAEVQQDKVSAAPVYIQMVTTLQSDSVEEGAACPAAVIQVGTSAGETYVHTDGTSAQTGEVTAQHPPAEFSASPYQNSSQVSVETVEQCAVKSVDHLMRNGAEAADRTGPISQDANAGIEDGATKEHTLELSVPVASPTSASAKRSAPVGDQPVTLENGCPVAPAPVAEIQFFPMAAAPDFTVAVENSDVNNPGAEITESPVVATPDAEPAANLSEETNQISDQQPYAPVASPVAASVYVAAVQVAGSSPTTADTTDRADKQHPLADMAAAFSRFEQLLQSKTPLKGLQVKKVISAVTATEQDKRKQTGQAISVQQELSNAPECATYQEKSAFGAGVTTALGVQDYGSEPTASKKTPQQVQTEARLKERTVPTGEIKNSVTTRAQAKKLAEQHQPFIPPKPTTKDGYPCVTFKTSDLKRWMAKERTRVEEQKRAQGLPFDDKG